MMKSIRILASTLTLNTNFLIREWLDAAKRVINRKLDNELLQLLMQLTIKNALKICPFPD